MANEQSGVKFFVIVTLVCLSAGPSVGQDDDDSEGSPILDVMQTLLKESSKGQQGGGLAMLGPMLQGFLQSGGGKQLGDMLNGPGKKSPAMSILSGLGALMQAQQRGKNGDENGGGGFDPAMLGTVIDLFASLNEAQGPGADAQSSGRKQKQGDAVDWEPMLGMVGSAVSSMMAGGQNEKSGGGGNGMEALLSFLPVLMSSLGGRHASHASGNVKHHDHAPFLPPFLENLHEYWDHFTSSQFGRALWENSGLAELAVQFQDEARNFVPAKVFENLENNSFRRQWIQGISSFVAEWANHVTDRETQKRYMDTVQVITNGFLQTEGYPQKSLLDLKKPGESISALIDEIFKRQFSFNVNSAQYVKPAIDYFQDVFGQSQRSGILSGITSETIESKLSHTLENQLIEPILRANRAYRFALKNPKCSKYVLCVISSDRDTYPQAAAIKPAVAKISGLAAAWFLATPSETSFFELFGTEAPCQRHNVGCSDFDDEDIKATTEYFHNEL